MVSAGGKRWPAAFDSFNPHIVIAVLPVTRRFFECGGKTAGGGTRNSKLRLTGANLDRANILFGDVPATTEQRQYPARIGVIVAADIHAEPDGIIKTSMIARVARLSATLRTLWPVASIRAITAFTPTITPAAIKHVFSRRKLCTVHADKRGGNIFCATFGKQPRAKRPIFILKFNGGEQSFKQALMITLADIFGSGHAHPFDVNLCAA